MVDSLGTLREEIRGVLAVHGLSLGSVRLLSGAEAPPARIASLKDGDLDEASALDLRIISQMLDEQLGTDLLQRFGELADSPFWAALRMTRRVMASVLLLGVTYLVLGATAEGRSMLTPDPVGDFAMLFGLLFLLAVFEGLQISVTILRLSDLSSVGAGRDRVRALHRSFRWEDGTRRFLAGRQFAVIVVVFFVSRLTTFQGNTVPFTQATMPVWLVRPLFAYGLAGALFALWWGQLLPQFLANRRPLWFGNLFFCTPAFVLGNLIERIGITDPADWVVRLDSTPPEEEIPISPQRRYQQAVHKIEGSGHLGVSKTWELDADGNATATQAVFTLVAADGIETLETQGPSIPDPAPRRFLSTQTLLRDGASEALYRDVRTATPLPGFDTQIASATPVAGCFRPGDVLRTSFSMEGDDPGSDTVPIVRPTKHLLFRVVLKDRPQLFKGVTVTVGRSGQGLGGGGSAGGRHVQHFIEAEPGRDGLPMAEVYFPYPDVGTVYDFTWSVEW